MNEEYIKSIYASNGGTATFGDYDKFFELMKNNYNYKRDVYKHLGGSKTLGDYDHYLWKIEGTTFSETSDSDVKKKDSSQSGSGSNQTQQSDGSQSSQGKSALQQAVGMFSEPKMSGTPQTPEQVAQSVAYAKSQQEKEPAKPKPAGPLKAPEASKPGSKTFSSETQLLDYMEELKADTSAESQAELKKISNDYAGIVSDINTNGSWSYESKTEDLGITAAGKVAQPAKPTFQTAKYQLDQINAGKLDPKTIDPNGRWEERNEYDAGSTYFDAAKGGVVTTQPGMKTKKVWVPSGDFAKKVDAESKDYLENKTAEMKAHTNIVERASNQKNWDTFRAVSQVDVTTPERDLDNLDEQFKNGQIDEQSYRSQKEVLENRKKYSYKNLESTYLSVLAKTDPDKHKEYSERYSEVMNALNKKGFETWEDANSFLIKNGKQNVIVEGNEDLEDLIGIDQSDVEFLRMLRAQAVGSSYAPIDKTIENASDRQVRQYMTDIQPVINDINQFSTDVETLVNSYKSGAITPEDYNSRVEQLKLKEQELTSRAKQVQKETGVTDFDLNRYSKESEVQQNLSANNKNFIPLYTFESEKEKNIKNRQRYVTENPVLGGLIYGTGDVWKSFTDMVILETAKSVKPLSEVLEVGDGYGWSDRLYYAAETAQNNRDYLYGYSGMDLDGDGKADDIPEFAKLTQTLGQGIGSVGAFALPGAIAGKVFSGAGKLATIGRAGVNTTGVFLMMEGQAYQEALRAGLSQDDAAESATLIASLQAVAEQIVPDIKYFDNVATRAGIISSWKAGIRGEQLARITLGKIDELAKNSIKGGSQEFIEESVGALATDLGKDVGNEVYQKVTTFNMDGSRPSTYKSNPYQNLYQLKNIVDNGVAGFITGSAMRLFTGISPMSQTQMQSLSYMGKNADDILRIIEQTESNGINPGDTKFKEIEKQLTGISETWDALQSIPGFAELTTANQDAVMALTYRKNQIQENANKIGVTTESVKTTLAQYDQEINDYLTGKKDYGADKPVMYNDDNLMAMGVRNVAVNPDGTYTIQPREDLNLDAAEVTKKAEEYIKTSLSDTAFADSFYHPKTDRNAIQERGAEEILPGQQGETTEAGGQPQGVGPGVQGQETTQEGGKKEVASTAETQKKQEELKAISDKIAQIQEQNKGKVLSNESFKELNDLTARQTQVQSELAAPKAKAAPSTETAPATGSNSPENKAKIEDIARRKQENDAKYAEIQARQQSELEALNKKEGKNYISPFDILNVNEYSRDQAPRSQEAIDLANRHNQEYEQILDEKRGIEDDASKISYGGYDITEKQGLANKLKDLLGRLYTSDKNALEEGFMNSSKALTEAEKAGGVEYSAHGMAKVGLAGASDALIDLLTNGINPLRGRGSLDTAPLAGGVSAGTTGGGNAYMEGPFTLVANKSVQGAITSVDQIAGIVVNDGIATAEVLDTLRQLFPNIVFESTSNTSKLVEQLNAKAESTQQTAKTETATQEVTPTTETKTTKEVKQAPKAEAPTPEIQSKIDEVETRRKAELSKFGTSEKQTKKNNIPILLDPTARVRGEKQAYVSRELMELAYKNDIANQEAGQDLDTIIRRGGYSSKELSDLLKPEADKINEKYNAEVDAINKENKTTTAPEKDTEAEAPVVEAPVVETPTTEAKPAAGVRAVKPKVFDTTRKNALLAKFKGDSGKRALVSSIDRAANAIRQAYGNVPIYVHETTADMEAATAITGGESMSRAGAGTFQYDDNGKVIAVHVNMEKAGLDTAPHEFTHLILMDAFGNNPKLFNEFKDRISKVLSASRVAELEAFANQYKDTEVRAEEFIAQLAGLMTANQEKLTPTMAQKIMNLINEFISRVTKGKLIPFKSNAQTKDLMDFFNTVSSAMATGKGGEKITAAAQKAGSKFETAKKPTQEAGARDRSKEAIVGQVGVETAADDIAKKDLNVAKDMEAANRAAQDIKSATGWEVGADGQWRYEYPDVELNEDIADDFDILFYLQENAKKEGVRVRPNEMYPPAPLSKILDFGKLEQAYPYISDIAFAVNPNLKGATAVFRPDKNLIEFGPNAIAKEGVKGFNKTLIHEVQHYIQDREGFDFGSNLTEESDKFSKSKDTYKIPGLSLNGAENVGKAVEKGTKEILDMMDNGITVTDIIEGNYDKNKYSGNPEAIIKHVADPGDVKSLDEMVKTDLDGAKKIVENAIKRNAIADVAYNQYTSIAGEVEARNAEKRSEIPYAERLYGKTLESTEDVARRDQILESAKKAVSAMDVISKKRGVSKAAEIKAQREILGENYDKAKQISDNFEDIAEKLGINKICGL